MPSNTSPQHSSTSSISTLSSPISSIPTPSNPASSSHTENSRNTTPSPLRQPSPKVLANVTTSLRQDLTALSERRAALFEHEQRMMRNHQAHLRVPRQRISPLDFQSRELRNDYLSWAEGWQNFGQEMKTRIPRDIYRDRDREAEAERLRSEMFAEADELKRAQRLWEEMLEDRRAERALAKKTRLERVGRR